MKFIALDLSTCTGYAVFTQVKNSLDLIAYGTLVNKVKGYKADIKSYKEFPEEYPDNFIEVAKNITAQCLDLIIRHKCTKVVIEHSEKGKQRLSQRLLEWIHLDLIRALKTADIDYKYLLVSDWRKVVKCYLKEWPEYQDWNKKVSKAKKQCTGKRKLAKIDGKVVSKINQKKLSIILANAFFNIEVKDDNMADAINLGRAAWELNLFLNPA